METIEDRAKICSTKILEWVNNPNRNPNGATDLIIEVLKEQQKIDIELAKEATIEEIKKVGEFYKIRIPLVSYGCIMSRVEEYYKKKEENKNNIPEMVDLGLPSGTLWAKCNIGAENEQDYGKYFAWGDAEGFEASKASGKFSSSWYAGRSGASLTGNISDNDATHNAAFVAYGAGCTIPNRTDFEELISGTNNEWTTIDGVTGCKFTNKTDSSKYIFIPAAGYADNGSVDYAGNGGYCWSFTYDNSDYAYYLCFDRYGDINVYSSLRYDGFSVRAIKRK